MSPWTLVSGGPPLAHAVHRTMVSICPVDVVAQTDERTTR